MGLLDDLLGQLAGGGAANFGPAADPRTTRGGGTGMEKIMMALIPVVLAMMARGRQGGAAGFDRSGRGGGLDDILGQVLGGGSDRVGGLGGLLEQFQRAGFGDQTRSWVSTGRNLPIPEEAFEQVFGRGGLAEIARRAGVSEQDASRGLSQLLPEMVDRMTPDGRLPDEPALDAGVDALAKRFGLA
jgi:uncharacterized protein YidB (DUF937 family)